MDDTSSLPPAASLLEGTPHPLALLSAAAAVVVANAAWNDVFPRSGGADDVPDPALRQACDACLGDRRRTGCELRGADGTDFVAHAWPSGDGRVWVSAQAAPDRSFAVLRDLINNVPTNVYASDADGMCVLSEGGLLTTLGLKAGERVGRSVYEGEELLPTVSGAIRQGYRGVASTVEFSLGPHVLTQTTIPRREPDGSLGGVYCIVSEVTEKRRDEAMLREQLSIIQEQKAAILLLSTPIIEVWDDVLAAPLVGVIDSERAAVITQSLLAAIATRRARHVILDLTGVDSVETASADHLIRIVRSITLLGAEAILTGIQPIIAQTIVGLGLDMTSVLTLRSLRDALRHCTDRARR